MTHGHHTLGIECKDMQSTRVWKMLFRNRIGVDPILTIISPMFTSLLQVNDPPVAWKGLVENLPTRMATAQAPIEPAFSGMRIICVQPHYYRIRQVEPCHWLGEEAKRFFEHLCSWRYAYASITTATAAPNQWIAYQSMFSLLTQLPCKFSSRLSVRGEYWPNTWH